MRILAIETSCDETAVAVVESEGSLPFISFKVLGSSLYSQAELHAKYGGVFPALAKREHGGNLAPLAKVALEEALLWKSEPQTLSEDAVKKIEGLLAREGELVFGTLEIARSAACPDIDAIAVTVGPGLEPALWVGVNFAKALSLAWNIPLIHINHMEGHLLSSLVREQKIDGVRFPLLALLISGGHTEFVAMKEWSSYEKIGETLDDAVGEAFDKVARMLDLPYPGGPQIAALAQEARAKGIKTEKKLPRPMLQSNNLDFSFSGLKTAVLYAVREREPLSRETRMGFAREFEDAAAETLVEKTRSALLATGAQTLVLGGGVAANLHIRSQMKEMAKKEFPDLDVRLPDPSLTGDNAIMIGIAALVKGREGIRPAESIVAEANLSF